MSQMPDREFRGTMWALTGAIGFLLVAIPVTLYLQERSMIEVWAPSQVASSVFSDAVLRAHTEPSTTTEVFATDIPDDWYQYVIVNDSCDHDYVGDCLRVRAAPSESAPVLHQLREGVVLKVSERVVGEQRDWYRVEFAEWLRYPERVSGDWYVAAEFVDPMWDPGVIEDFSVTANSEKRIIVDRSEQKLRAYEGESLFLETIISTGIELTPTPRGEFTIFRKTPTRYMQGPLPYLPVSKYYDLPGVPWNLYFTEQGAVIHGAYWHNSFGKPYSSGCVNMVPEEARMLYEWADLGTTVIVRD